MRIPILLSLFALLLAGCNSTGGGSTPSSASTNGSGTTAQSTSVQLSWTASTGSVTGYLIEQSTNGVSFSQVQSTGSANTSAVVGGLSPGTTYYFRVRAFNSGGDSGYSSVASISM